MCDQNEIPHRIYTRMPSSRFWYLIWRAFDIRITPPFSTTNNTFIYGKSPLNATQNEFNNESDIKMVICYARVRAKGMAECVWRDAYTRLSLDQFRWFSFCSFISSELVSLPNRRIRWTICSPSIYAVRMCIWRNAIQRQWQRWWRPPRYAYDFDIIAVKKNNRTKHSVCECSRIKNKSVLESCQR